jgi:hypothetical protein
LEEEEEHYKEVVLPAEVIIEYMVSEIMVMM